MFHAALIMQSPVVPLIGTASVGLCRQHGSPTIYADATCLDPLFEACLGMCSGGMFVWVLDEDPTSMRVC